MSPYREKLTDPDNPRSFVIPAKTEKGVIFLDAIMRVYVSDKRLYYGLVDGSSVWFSYETEDDAEDSMKNVVDAKVRWDEYKMKRSAPSILYIADPSAKPTKE